MFCPHCGTQLPDTAGFCSQCGQKVSKQPMPQTPPAPQAPQIPQAPQAPQAPKLPPMPKVQKKPKPPKPPKPPKKPKEKKSLRPLLPIIGFGVLIAAIYIGITVAFILLQSMKNGIKIESLYAEEFVNSMSFGKFLTLLQKGNRIFHPTVVSTTLSLSLRALYWLVPVFGLVAVIGAMMNKKTKRLCIVTSVMIGITALLTAVLVPVSLWLIPDLKYGLASQGGVLFEDLGSVSFLWPIIIAVIALVLTVGVIIATNAYRKWRNKA